MTNNSPIKIVQIFEAPIDKVWRAITEPDHMRKWYFEAIADFQPKVGFETEFNVNCEGKDYLHLWEVQQVQLERRLGYRWRYDGYPGDSTVIWDLCPCDTGTKLTFTHTGSESIKGDPMFNRENCEAGWKYFITDSLKTFLSQ